MASLLALAGLAAIVGFHTLVAALLVRFFRVRLATRWGPAVYTALVIPFVLLVSTLVLSGVLGLGPNVGGPGPALFLLVGVPLVIGVTVDYVWMPHPEEVDLPDTV